MASAGSPRAKHDAIVLEPQLPAAGRRRLRFWQRSASVPHIAVTQLRHSGVLEPGRPTRKRALRHIPTLYGAARTAPYFHDNSAATLEAMLEHYQAMFKFMAFVDVEGGLFAPLSHGQGCERGTCDFAPIAQTESLDCWRSCESCDVP